MRKQLLVLSFLFTISWSMGQQFSFNIYFEDAQGNKDTLTLGYDTLATNGIDAGFGEVNILGQSWDSVFEVRAVMDDSFSFPQNQGDPVYVHPINQSKKQFVYFKPEPPYNPMVLSSSHAIGIVLKNKYKPFSMTWDSSLFADSSIYSSCFTPAIYSCSCGYLASYVDSVVLNKYQYDIFYYSLGQDTLYYMFFYFTSIYTVGFNNVSSPTKNIKIYPNPAHNAITLRFTGADDRPQQLAVYNHLGQSVLQREATGEFTTLDISGLPAGVYLIEGRTRRGKRFTGRFVKE